MRHGKARSGDVRECVCVSVHMYMLVDVYMCKLLCECVCMDAVSCCRSCIEKTMACLPIDSSRRQKHGQILPLHGSNVGLVRRTEFLPLLVNRPTKICNWTYSQWLAVSGPTTGPFCTRTYTTIREIFVFHTCFTLSSCILEAGWR